MVELTHGGAWLKWSSLNRRDRNWALLSFVTAGLAAAPLGIAAGEWTHHVGYLVGSGGRQTPAGQYSILATDLFAYCMLAAALLAIISAFAWWRFSMNQDEMFNRIQNYAIAQAGGWTLAFASLWWMLMLGGWLGPLPLTALVVFGFALVFVFWFQAVRRWL